MKMNTPSVVSAQEWEAARQQLLVKEKALTRARDALAAERRRMPWLAVEKAYAFDGPKGKASLVDLFEGRRQLIVYRAFFEPGVYGWPEHACRGCSMVADQVAHVAHLNARDTTLAFASRAPLADIDRLKMRMDWTMPWYSITDSFDADFGVDEWHGTNVFIRNGDKVFRTYFINNRGDEQMGSTWNYLDITALGRQEAWEDSPEGYPQTAAVQVVELARRLRRHLAVPVVERRRSRPRAAGSVRREHVAAGLVEAGLQARRSRRLLRRPPRQLLLMRDAQRNQIGTVDAELVGNAMQFAFLGQRDRVVNGRQREQAPQQRQLLLVGRQGRQLPGDEEVGRAAEQQIAFRGELDDGRGLVGGELAFIADNCFHGARLFRRDTAIGVGNASQDVGERGEKLGAFRFQVLERLERLAEWRRLV